MDNLQRIKELTEKLDEAETRLIDFIQNLNVGVVEAGPDHKIIYCNPKFADIVQRPLGELINSDMLELHHESSPAEELFTRLLNGESLEDERVVYVLPDGSQKVCHTWSSPRFIKGHFINTRCIIVPK